MKSSRDSTSSFSLVEVTLALGVAAFCLIAVLGLLPAGITTQKTSIEQTVARNITSEIIGDLRAGVRARPPAQASKNFGITLPSDSKSPWNPVPTTLYFSNEGKKQNASDTAVFAANIVYTSSTDTTAFAKITISWPAAQSDLTKVAGAIETIAVVNRAVP